MKHRLNIKSKDKHGFASIIALRKKINSPLETVNVASAEVGVFCGG